jgi:hypothetical protein
MRCQKKLTNGKICRNKILHIDKSLDKSLDNLYNNIEKYYCNKHIPLNIEELKCCCICMKEDLQFEEIIFLECNHIFHKPCLINWFNKTNNNLYNCREEDSNLFINCILCRNKILKKVLINNNNNNKFLRNDNNDFLMNDNKLIVNKCNNKTLLYKIFPDLYKKYKNKFNNSIDYNLFYDIYG